MQLNQLKTNRVAKTIRFSFVPGSPPTSKIVLLSPGAIFIGGK